MRADAALARPVAQRAAGPARKRLPIALLAAAFAAYLAWSVSVRQAALFVVGAGLGVALAGARFGFTTGWRTLVVARDPRGVVGQVVLLALASAA